MVSDPWEEGESLADLLDIEWSVFSDDARDNANALVEVIFTIGVAPEDRSNGGFAPDDLWTDRKRSFTILASPNYAWEQFKRHLRHGRRFIPEASQLALGKPEEWLPGALVELETLREQGEVFYRCRRDSHILEEMGAPPNEYASAGRANPRGISFLYLSTDHDTVVAEMRPWRGQKLTVAEFQLLWRGRLVDLTRTSMPAPIESPFGIADWDSELRRRENAAVLHQLSEELSTPVDPENADLDYLPTQYLTELICSMGYDGLIFRSALANGHNLVLFNPNQAAAIAIRSIQVTNISYCWEKSPCE